MYKQKMYKSYRNVVFGWFPTQQAQECLRKLSYKQVLKQAILQSLRRQVEASNLGLGINQLHLYLTV